MGPEVHAISQSFIIIQGEIFKHILLCIFSGYQSYATTTGNPATAGQLGATAAAAAASQPRFPGQPAIAATAATVPGAAQIHAAASANGYRAAAPPPPGGVQVSPTMTGATASPGATAQHPVAAGQYVPTSTPQAGTVVTNSYVRGPSPSDYNSQQQQPQHQRFPKTGFKRKYDESGSGESGGDSSGFKTDSTPHGYYRLYCKVCRVTLNAPAQAKQHYEGKNHAKKLKLHSDGDETSSAKPSPDKARTESSSNKSVNGTAAKSPSDQVCLVTVFL